MEEKKPQISANHKRKEIYLFRMIENGVNLNNWKAISIIDAVIFLKERSEKM